MELQQHESVSKKEGENFAKLILEEKFGCHVTDIGYIGGGSFGYVYLAHTDAEPSRIIMKVCRKEGMCRAEALALETLGKDSLIKLPEVYFTHFSDERIPVDIICMEYIEGKDCFTNFFLLFKPKKVKAEFADKVTAAMRHWHEMKNEKFGSLEAPEYDSWLDYYRPFAHEILLTARRLAGENRLEKFVLSAMERAWQKFDYIFSEPVLHAGLIHGDLNVMNIMADADLNVTAIIDPLDSRWADTEFDLFQLRNLTGNAFGLYKTYKKKYPVSQKCDIKTAFYALFHEVYCYICSGEKVNIILFPLVFRMNRELRKL